MSELTMIGLGAMGGAVARALIEKGHDLTVWNRSPDKALALTELGAGHAGSLGEAIAASPIVLVCLHGYDTTKSLLGDPQILPLLDGRIILQMSTGTPAEARAAEAWVNRHGGSYLDCAITVYPPSIGRPDGQLLFSGAEDVFDQCAPYVSALGGDIRYLGAPVGAAAALDLAIVTRLVTVTVATVYGIHICESEGIDLRQFSAMYPENDRAQHLVAQIESGRFDRNIAATTATAIEVISSIRGIATDLGINTELPDFLLGLYRRAEEAGLLELDNASLVEVFRANPAHREEVA